MTSVAFRVLAKYMEKKKVPKATGKGKTTVYVYSERAVAKRHRDKVKRLEKFSQHIHKLRAKVKRDLKAADAELRLTALVIALIDETHERIGSPESARGELNQDGEPHFGVSQWLKKQVTLGPSSASIKYVGKSGVKHEKKVTTPFVLAALRKACKEADGDESRLFEAVTPAMVNEYLDPFGISARDLRGLAANGLMKKALKKVRSSGGKLPSDAKKREQKLKAEFKEALEQVAEEIGHEASTLASQYLAPAMQPRFEKDGTVIERLDEDA